MKKLTTMLLFILASFVQAQNTLPGAQWFSEIPSTKHPVNYGEDWYYGVMAASDGSFLGTGYAEIPDPNNVAFAPKQPTIVKLDKDGNFLWETALTNNDYNATGEGVSGYGVQIIEDATGYIVFGIKVQKNSANNYSNSGHFSARVDKNTGVIDPTWGFKYYNVFTLGLDALGYVHMNLDYTWAEEIRDNTGAITGFILASSINKNNDAVHSNNVDFASVSGVAIKLDASGNIDPTFTEPTTGGLGYKFIKPNTSTLFPSTSLKYATIEYDALGNPQNFIFTGTVNENPSAYASNSGYTKDAFVCKTNLNGNIVWQKTFSKSPASMGVSYIDNLATDNNPCLDNIKTNDEAAVYVEQLTHGGDFVMVAQFNIFVNGDGNSNTHTCTNNRLTGPDGQGYLQTDPAVIRFNSAGVFQWAINIPNSTGIDFFNPLKVMNNGTEAVVGGNYAGTTGDLVMPQLTKLDVSSATTPTIKWNKTYMDFVNNQKNVCLFGIDITADNGYVIGGNNDAGLKTPVTGHDEDYEMIKVYSDCNSQQTYDITGPYNILSTSPTSVKNWNTSHKVIGVVRVKAGATLTISGATTMIEFADYRQTGIDTKIIVEAGGKLVVTNGAVLTSVQACPGSFWNGIEVQGDINYRQYVSGGYDANHGIAILNTGATIQNAHYALNNFATINGGIDWVKLGGGIIQCNGANFINCQKGANFLPYTNFIMSGTSKILIADRSSFINCTFKTDATLTPATGFNPEVGISMWQTKGVTIRGNTFINATPNVYQIPNRGSGIGTYDASFNCVSTPNNFTNLFYGIDASSSLPSISLWVDANVFTNNHRGIALHGMHYTKTNNNTFTIGEPYSDSNGNIVAPCGIYLESCEAYQVQSNTMSNAVGTSNTTDFGIVAHLTGLNPNELRQNTFTNIAYGIQAQNKNSGLQLKCNKFTTGTIGAADIKVQSLAGYTNGSIAPMQGACSSFPTTLPGNEFSQTCGTAKDLEAYFPYYNVTTYNTRNTVAIETPPNGCFSASYFVNPCFPPPTGLVCPPIPCCLNPQQLRLAIKTSKQDVKNLEQLLATGDAPMLYTALATNNETQIKNKLLNRSPYLSDAVLLAFITHNPQLSESTIKDILLANSPLSDNIYQSLIKLKLSASTADAIKMAQVGQSQRTYTELNLTYEKSQLQINYNNLLSYVLNDLGNEARFDSLLKNMDMVINPKSRAVLASAFIEQKQFTQAQVQIDSLQSIDPAMSSYLQTVMQLQQTVNQLQAYSGSIKTQIDAVRMQDSSTLAVKANALYNALFNKKFNERIYLNSPTTNNAKMAHNNVAALDADNSISVYPNPANELIYFKLNTETTNNMSIELYSITGQLVASKICDVDKSIQEIETTHLQSGMYFYRILQNSVLIKTNKIVIIK